MHFPHCRKFYWTVQLWRLSLTCPHPPSPPPHLPTHTHACSIYLLLLLSSLHPFSVPGSSWLDVDEPGKLELEEHWRVRTLQPEGNKGHVIFIKSRTLYRVPNNYTAYKFGYSIDPSSSCYSDLTSCQFLKFKNRLRQTLRITEEA